MDVDAVTVPEVVTWKCIDDGTGKNVLYISSQGEKRRKEPADFIPETIETISGTRRKYVFRGSCVRCKKRTPVFALALPAGLTAYAVNYCESCLLAVTIPSIKRLRNNGAAVFESTLDAPMTAYIDVKAKALDPERERRLIEDSKQAKYNVSYTAKLRRNAYRYNMILTLKTNLGVKGGHHVSWGFDSNAFDEYFGDLNASKQPHGHGVRFYSDGTVYVGGFVDGLPHCDEGGVMKRPNGAEYEGSWINGLKHGAGRQVHPDGAVYVGEFAKGYEHGSGEMTYKDGSTFQGKFRYGRRDGQGVYITSEGVKTKGVFRDNEGYTEKPPPTISEEILDDDSLFQPPSLLRMCIESLATVMRTHRQLYPIKRVTNRLHTFLKPLVAKEYLGSFLHLQLAKQQQQQKLLLQQQKEQEQLLKQQKQLNQQSSTVVPSSVQSSGRRGSVSPTQLLLPQPPPMAATASISSAAGEIATEKSVIEKTADAVVMYDFVNGMEQIAMQNQDIIWFSGIKLISEDIESLCYFEGANHCLRELRLPSCKLKAYSIDLIAQHIERGCWPNLTLLDISYSVIEFATIQILTEALSAQPIRTLRLSCCGIRPNGAELIAQLVQSSDSLTDLDISFNAIGVPGAHSLAEALVDNETLLYLNIRGNGIQPAGGLSLAEALKTNYTIKELIVADNKIGNEVTTAIASRIHSTVDHLKQSFRSAEITIPNNYRKGRYANAHRR